MSDDPSAPGGDSQEVQVEPGRRPTFTITEAAAACAVSRKTITRKLPDLAAAGAGKDDDGIWRIPVEALLALGLHPGRSVPSEAMVDLRRSDEPPPAIHLGPEMITISRERWDDLRIRLARAEAEATERGRALEDARLALRALTAGPSAVPASEVTQSVGEERGAFAMPAAPMPATSLPVADADATRGIGVVAGAPSVWDTLLGSQAQSSPSKVATSQDVRLPSPTEPSPVLAGVGSAQGPVPVVMPTMSPLSMPAMSPVSMPAELPRRRWWDFLR